MMGLGALSRQRPQLPALALGFQCPELSHRDPLATCLWTSVSSSQTVGCCALLWCQSQLIPALGGGTHYHPFLLPRQCLAPASGLGHSTWAAWPVAATGWPGQGYHCQEWKLVGAGPAAGGCRAPTLPGTCQIPAPPLFSLQHTRPEKLRAHVGHSSSPSPHCPSPRQVRCSQVSLPGAQVIRCMLCAVSIESHRHVTRCVCVRERETIPMFV